jgi:CelD/BcsL family acetyltransferase involved in cellulose biosynthesis
MIEAEVLHPAKLGASDRALWAAWCEATPAFHNPLLGPGFTDAVGAVREDARVAVLRDGGLVRGFLPFHARPSGYARPIGSPFSDYHALITAPNAALDGAAALAAAGVSAFRVTSLIDPYGCFAGVQGEVNEGYVMRLDSCDVAGAEAYSERLRVENPKRFKNWRRLENKLEREVGPVRMVGPDYDQAAFDLLVRWKREQLKRTGLHDFFGPDWVRVLMQGLFEKRDGDLQGLMVTLRAGDRIIAGHFGVRQGATFHPWIASIDPDGGAWSPGQSLLSQAIKIMPALGLTHYDLAPSHGHYKAPFCLDRVPVREGMAVASTAAGRLRSHAEDAWSLAGRASSVVGKLRRRMDHVSAVELSMPGRVRGLVQAVAAQGRRGRGTAGVDDALGGV